MKVSFCSFYYMPDNTADSSYYLIWHSNANLLALWNYTAQMALQDNQLQGALLFESF